MASQSIPESYFHSLKLGSAIITNIKRMLGAGNKLLDVLRLVQSDPTVNETSRKRLLLASDITQVCGTNTDAATILLNDAYVSDISLIALKYYCTKDKIPGITNVRLQLLYLVPTAVLSAVVDHDVFTLEKHIKDALSRLLSVAVREHFDVRSGSLGKFIAQPACQDEFSTLGSEDAQTVRALLETLYRLHTLVVDAEELRYLVGTRFTSAHAIASTDQDEFVSELERQNVPYRKAASIYLEATRIDRRNEAYWADIIRTRREVPVLAMNGADADVASPEPDSGETNLTTLFNDLDNVASEIGTSVLGPASYLVDLLQMLSRMSLSRSPPRPVDKALTALDIFLHRRPDIANIELSSTNSETPIPYLKLVTEVMESYVDAKLNPASAQKRDIYEAISRQLAPMTIFPYNHAIAITRNFLKARGYSRYELVRRFRSDQDLASRAFPANPQLSHSHIAAAKNTHERRIAAEYLGLQPVHIQAITRETFHTPEFVRLLQNEKGDLAAQTYGQVVGLSTPGEYWGSQSTGTTQTADWNMLDPASKTNLRLVKDQLLKRSGLSLPQLNKVLKTRYMGNRLVLTMTRKVTQGNRETVEFSDRLMDMRMQESLMVTEGEKTGSLSEQTCSDLQAFIRLHHALGWSIETTDAAISVLARRSKVYKDDSRRYYVLDGGFIQRLASAQQLSVETGVPLVELLPLWGPMDAQFPASLYSKLFLNTGLSRIYPLLALSNGDTLPEATFGQNMVPMLQALRMTQADQAVFMKLLGFDPSTPWTLDRLATLYSHSKMCQILDLPTARYSEWWQLCQGVADPFLDPQSSLSALLPWLHLPTGLSSVEASLDLLAPITPSASPSATHLDAISLLINGITSVEAEFAAMLAPKTDIEATQVYTRDALLNTSSRILSLATANAVVALVEGQSTSDSSAVRIFSQQFGIKEEKVHEEFAKPLSKVEPLERENELTLRRKTAILWMIPEVKRRAMDEVVKSTLTNMFPDTESNLLGALLAMVAPTSAGNSATYLEQLKSIWDRIESWFKPSISEEIYFFPPTTADFIFVTGVEKGDLLVNQQSANFVSGISKRSSAPWPMRQGKACLLSFSQGLTLGDVMYSTSDGEEQFRKELLCPVTLAQEFSFALKSLERSLSVAKALDLKAAEVTFQHGQGVDFSSADPRQFIKLKHWVDARACFKTSDEVIIDYCSYLARVANSSVQRLKEDEAMAQLVAQTHHATSLDQEDISTFFKVNWSSKSVQELSKFLLDLSPLQHLVECCEMASTLAVPLTTLYRWARLPVLPSQAEDFELFGELQAALSSGTAVNALASAKDALGSTQQRVLHEYLLSMPTIQAMGLKTVDDLSSEFLIDLKMGPAPETSRIGQAIASIQLFVQRSLLGLEKVYGISPTKVDQSRWKWACKYTLWQANRKVFMYPENWVDPSLRDDKTQAFRQLENNILQSNLNKESISQLLREYIYSIHEIANLDIQSFLWEAKKGFRGNYHFFARTRTSPFTFYYRRLSVIGATAASMRWDWYPWEKMEMEIQTHEIDINNAVLPRAGSYLLPALFKGRLFLFIPQITRQITPAKAKQESLYDMAQDETWNNSPTEYWEIKMSWAEMRNGKWSQKYTSVSGIEVRGENTAAPPSVSSFRFRLNTRSYNDILIVYVDTQKRENDTTWSFVNLGQFEMQGPVMRLVNTASGSKVGSSMDSRTQFGRILMRTSAGGIQALRKEVEECKLGIASNQKSLLAVPSPENVRGAYDLTWLLGYDDSQFDGASGLTVERSTTSNVDAFFGYPQMTREGEIDITYKTTVVTEPLTHEMSIYLVEAIAESEGHESIFTTLEDTPDDMASLAFGHDGNTYGELLSPSSIYNWEVGFHAVALMVERLFATQQFELALEVSRLVFDPSRDGTAPTSGSANPQPLSQLKKCWRFVPFKSSELRLAGSVRTLIQRLAPGATSTEIADWESNPFSPHTVARQRPAVYMKRFVMKCIEILIASGDEYFRQNSLEAMPLATQRYVEASELFGPAPITIDPPNKPVTKTYASIKALVNSFSTASVDMELEFPYFNNPVDRTHPYPPPLRDETLGFIRSTYFSVPANPQIQALRDVIDSRLYNIRNGLDINGNVRRLPLFDPPLDPGQLIASVSAGFGLPGFAESVSGPMPVNRARLLLQKALELCDELQTFSDAFVSIKERRDAEAMASLRAHQDIGVLALLTDVKTHQIHEATLSIDSLEETRKGHTTRLKYYLSLIGEPTDNLPSADTEWVDLQQNITEPGKDELRMSPEELSESNHITDAMGNCDVVTVLEQTAGILMALPNFTIETEPFGVGVSTQVDASNVGRGIMVGAGKTRAGIEKSFTMAERAARKGEMVRQLQDRRMQANMAGRDIKVVDKEIVTQRKRINIAEAELRAHQQQVADAAESEAYLRTKYTSDKLYSWLEMETRKMAYQIYLSAMEMAKTSEKALFFEYGPKSQSFLANSYWDEARDGIMAAQNLKMSLRRMEKFHMQNAPHDFEITKVISLRQMSPLRLIELRTKGTVEFEIPELMFDQDFPGHYCRRIKTVSVSIPCIVGPYTGVTATLKLLEHRYRLKAGRSSTGSYFRQDTSDERFHTDLVPISSVALSTCNQDTGTFEINFNDERYVPFEGAGVISKWKLELPGPYPQFDYRSISDVLFTIRYTAIDGGAIWKKEASDAVREFRSKLDQQIGTEGAYFLVDLRADFADEWSIFSRQIAANSDQDAQLTMNLSRISRLMPYWSPSHTVKVQRVWAAIRPAADGWAPGGSVTLLDSELEEQEGSNAELRMLATPQNTFVDQELLKTSLSMVASAKRFNQKPPENCWVVIQYTRP